MEDSSAMELNQNGYVNTEGSAMDDQPGRSHMNLWLDLSKVEEEEKTPKHSAVVPPLNALKSQFQSTALRHIGEGEETPAPDLLSKLKLASSRGDDSFRVLGGELGARLRWGFWKRMLEEVKNSVANLKIWEILL